MTIFNSNRFFSKTNASLSVIFSIAFETTEKKTTSYDYDASQMNPNDIEIRTAMPFIATAHRPMEAL